MEDEGDERVFADEFVVCAEQRAQSHQDTSELLIKEAMHKQFVLEE